jgi:hypothetical protein
MMPNFSIARIAGAAFVVIASNVPGAATLDSISISSGSVSVKSLGPSTLIAGVGGAWVLYAPTLSVDCSPPRGCYAKTQRIHYDFSCSPRYIVLTERISMISMGPSSSTKCGTRPPMRRHTTRGYAGIGHVLSASRSRLISVNIRCDQVAWRDRDAVVDRARRHEPC